VSAPFSQEAKHAGACSAGQASSSSNTCRGSGRANPSGYKQIDTDSISYSPAPCIPRTLSSGPSSYSGYRIGTQSQAVTPSMTSRSHSPRQSNATHWPPRGSRGSRGARVEVAAPFAGRLACLRDRRIKHGMTAERRQSSPSTAPADGREQWWRAGVGHEWVGAAGSVGREGWPTARSAAHSQLD
jgi:hypothetical protein